MSRRRRSRSCGSSMLARFSGTAAGTGARAARGSRRRSNAPARHLRTCGRGRNGASLFSSCARATSDAGSSPGGGRAGGDARSVFFVGGQGASVRAKQLAGSAISRYEKSGTDPGALRHAYVNLAISEQKLGNSARSREIYEAARADADDRSLAMILGNLGNMDLEEHNYAGASSNIEAAAAIHRRLGLRLPLANNILD